MGTGGKSCPTFAEHSRQSSLLLDDPPYHSQYNPAERCWGILEKH